MGRIDRVDRNDATGDFRVIDYKTGRDRAKGTFHRGEALQLPIYLHAAAMLLDADPADGESQYFYATSRGESGRHVISGAEITGRRKEFDQVLSTIADGVDSGFFAPNPRHEHCKFCDYRDVCDTKIGHVMERKAADTRGGAYLALEEIE
jgi:RecB family exonuclease